MEKEELKQDQNKKSLLWEFFKMAIISLAIIIPIRYFLIQPFVVKGESMEPSFQNGDYLIIDEISYRFMDIERGDVVIFKYPNDHSQYFIKRVLGLPGEVVKIEDGKVYITNRLNPGGIEVEEDYIPMEIKTYGSTEVKLKQNEFFVLGDNRVASSDSRIWGPVSEKEIVGKVWVVGWPFEKFGLFDEPNYKL